MHFSISGESAQLIPKLKLNIKKCIDISLEFAYNNIR